MGNGYPVVQPDDSSQLREELKEIKRRLRELERPTGTQQNSTVRELVSRTTVAASAFGFDQTFTSNLGTTDTGATTTLSLDQDRRVVFLTTITFFMAVTAGSGSRFVQGYHGVLLDGVTKSSTNTSTAPNGTVGFSYTNSVTLTGMHAFTVAAGTHTLSTYVQGFVTGSGMQGEFSSPTITAMVLQAV